MKVKPFYIRITEEMTPQVIQDAIDKCVDAGATAEECVEGASGRHKYYTENHINYWDSFGVNVKGETFFWDVGNGTDNGKFGGIQNEITLDQLDEWLGLDETEKPEEKEALDSMANNLGLTDGSEWKSGDECVIKNPEGLGVWDEASKYLGSTGTVMAVFTNTNGLKVAAVSHDDKTCICWMLSMLEKPETPQQREERERLEEIGHMARFIKSLPPTVKMLPELMAEKLYDASYRKAK